ncbi:hypothetical protein TRFO_02208 [Tritrichomonas foetus]|uniref:Uncharacterized protein n=1 Tax=Tritrichomonas foetus TaxID=1144522 RepID=A0A1J4J986_9EUKA|nr:hypothetical protein TRFO_02208 [Tritrichomonas foetus]|eukprot:OHS95233.1 hypothetical protein TRFO_02208 [Tritrichomonas foetus]
MTSLHFASLAGNVEMVELISNFPGMDLNAKNSISFSCCIKLKQMLYDETPLHLAVKNNHIDAAMLLASKEGIDLNAKDSVYSFIFMKEFFISYSSKSNASFNIQK